MTIEGRASDTLAENFPIRIVVPQPGKGKRPLATRCGRTQQGTEDSGPANSTARTVNAPCGGGWQRSCTGPTIEWTSTSTGVFDHDETLCHFFIGHRGCRLGAAVGRRGAGKPPRRVRLRRGVIVERVTGRRFWRRHRCSEESKSAAVVGSFGTGNPVATLATPVTTLEQRGDPAAPRQRGIHGLTTCRLAACSHGCEGRRGA